MNIRDEIIHGNAVHNIVLKIYKYWNKKYNTNSSEFIIEKSIKADKWIISNNYNDIDEKELLEEMMCVLKKDSSMFNAFQKDLENYKKRHLRIVWVDRKPVLLDFSMGINEMNSFSSEQITQNAIEVQNILNRQKLINICQKDMIDIIKSLYTHLDFLKPNLTTAKKEWKDLCILSKKLNHTDENRESTYPDNTIYISKKIKEYFLEE